MKIIADDKMPGLEDLFAAFGDIYPVNGRNINQALVRDADVLLVRSITRVDDALLHGSSIRFVGTATSGLDHIDQQAIKARSIHLAHARGSNADAVVDYCLAAMAELLLAGRMAGVPKTVGIVGAGETGSRLAQRLKRLGIAVRLCDLPLQQKLAQAGQEELAGEFCDLHELTDCELVSVHVPLEKTGPWASENLLNAAFLASLKKGTVLLNAARGGVVDEAALLRLVGEQAAPVCVFDVWNNEPRANPALVDYCSLATPHIAGYSQRAKLQTSRVLAQQLQGWSNDAVPADREAELFTAQLARLLTNKADVQAGDRAFWQAIARALPLAALSHDFKAATASAGGDMAAAEFDAFRGRLQQRREFCEIEPQAVEGQQRELLAAAGFVTMAGDANV